MCRSPEGNLVHKKVKKDIVYKNPQGDGGFLLSAHALFWPDRVNYYVKILLDIPIVARQNPDQIS